jgi:hypothetical protein
LLAVFALVAACEQSAKPRSFEFFMEDGFAREGVLARCNQSADASGDEECANARRAASAIAAEEDSAKSSDRAAQSQRKLVAMRDRSARAEQAQHEAEAAAQAAAEAAYEARWRGGASAQGAEGSAAAPAFGAPLGKKLPAIDDAAKSDDVYGESLSQVPARPEIELAAIEPPKSEVPPARVEIEKTAIIPRPFHQADLNGSPR